MLKFRYRMTHRSLPKAMGRLPSGHGKGPEGRLERMRLVVTKTVRDERIEGNLATIDESRGYTERLIQEAIKHGDQHRATMEMADYWLKEKDLIHKLFKVLVPRYRDYTTCFTSIHRLPIQYPGTGKPLCVLELKGNPYPLIQRPPRDLQFTLTNVLLNAARKEYHKNKTRHEQSEVTHTDNQSDPQKQTPGGSTSIGEIPPEGTPV